MGGGVGEGIWFLGFYKDPCKKIRQDLASLQEKSEKNNETYHQRKSDQKTKSTYVHENSTEKKVSNQGPGPTPRNGLARVKHVTHGAV
jgi:hypothetical protein